jgi:hypothetical protein
MSLLILLTLISMDMPIITWATSVDPDIPSDLDLHCLVLDLVGYCIILSNVNSGDPDQMA